MNTLFHTEPLQIADRQFTSRLLTGTGKFSSSQVMAAAIQASGSELATMALRRVRLNARQHAGKQGWPAIVERFESLLHAARDAQA